MAENIEAHRALSIRDIARLAGVSHQTVSRVLNSGPNLKPATEARVRKVIEEHAWRPNSAARALATSRSRMIGILVSSRSQYGPFSAASAVEAAARERGYTITSATLDAGGDDRIAAALDAFVAQGVDGVMLIAPQQRAHEAIRRVAIGLPFMTLQWPTGPVERVAAFDHYQGARRATQHLVDLGHTRIAHIAGPQDWNEAEERMHGFLDVVSESNLTTVAPILGDWTADFGYEAGLKLLPRRDFTAVFASNDQMALGLMHAANELGVSVPGDLSVVGFDDIPEAKHFTPPLTTMRQDFPQLGKRALDILISDIEKTAAPPVQAFAIPELIVRGSTTKPR